MKVSDKIMVVLFILAIITNVAASNIEAVLGWFMATIFFIESRWS